MEWIYGNNHAYIQERGRVGGVLYFKNEKKIFTKFLFASISLNWIQIIFYKTNPPPRPTACFAWGNPRNMWTLNWGLNKGVEGWTTNQNQAQVTWHRLLSNGYPHFDRQSLQAEKLTSSPPLLPLPSFPLPLPTTDIGAWNTHFLCPVYKPAVSLKLPNL